MSDSFSDRIRRGEVVPVGHKLYALCAECGSVVQINKPLIGSMHLCLTDEEREQVARSRRQLP